ncbi:RT0821/Lpp0805 family surface protein [Stappia sp. ES.058]|uniref:RT0821/Lpp0805 family surface protein n=1 Tax=Stappia sp. ES.058 TaxID=1881061 RepID=UPI00087DD0C2|nr:RT0821/Lpp0805 family surface protein [Stappia sp. ES.058]SDT99236.1 Surface antigen [Stappia sp. ES.058]
MDGELLMNAFRLVLAVGLAAVAAGCTSSQGSGATGPVVVGGSLFGSAFSAPSVPQSEADRALADLLKTDAGQAMTDTDRRAAATALRGALSVDRTGETVEWRNRTSGARGRVVTGPNYQVNNIVCRDYTHIILIDERESSLRGAACRGETGTWQPIT